MSTKWKWICGPVQPRATCKGCSKRLWGEHLVEWTDGSTWHLACLLDSLAEKPRVAPVTHIWDSFTPP